jgi:RimJ/RimL family protein N-acetyltransferase
MYWVGYLYRYFCYTYDVSSKQAYKYLPLKYVASTFISYHSLDVSQAIERLLEAKKISFKEEDILRRGVDILRVIRNVDDPYQKFPVFGNERFLLRKIEESDAKDLLQIYSDEKSVPFFNSDNRNGDNFHYSTIKRMKEAIDFWEYCYHNRHFVRWAILDKSNNSIIGTIEQFHRDSNDYFNNCSLLRLDLRSDYEKKEYIYSILKLIIPSSFTLFNCDKIVTKLFEDNIERENALYELGFKKPNKELIGNGGEKYLGYVELVK